MTILTKPSFVAKAPEENQNTAENGAILDQDVQRENDKLFLLQFRARRAISVSSILLILATICLLCLALMTGLVIYRRAQQQKMHFRGFCGFPSERTETDDDREALMAINRMYQALLSSQDDFDESEKFFQNNHQPEIFKESFDLSVGDDHEYSNIYVPEFGDGRVGRFIHDFKNNQTGIVDESKRRCFIMPLDRNITMAPKSMADLIQKLYAGYYEVNTTAIRKNMRVVTPAIEDMSTVSPKVQDICSDMAIYRLEPFVSGVYKRSVRSADLKSVFKVFSGKQYVDYHISE